jgi:hypothetical protein
VNIELVGIFLMELEMRCIYRVGGQLVDGTGIVVNI